MQLFTIKEALSYGWETLKKNFWFLVGVFAFIIVVSGIVSSISEYATKHNMDAISAVVQLLGFLIQLMLGIGSTRIALDIYNGTPTSFKKLFVLDKTFLPYLGATLLYMIIVIVGFVLLIIPGFMWMIKYQLYPWLVIDKGMSSREAIKASGVITKGSRNKLLLFWITSLGISFVGILIVGVGLFPAVALLFMASAYIYKKLSTKLDHIVPAVAPTEGMAQ